MQLQQPLTEIDLDAYFQRIGYSGDCSPRLTTLQAIHQRHSQTIAFENLNSLLKQPVKLDLASLQQKLINEGRGGYCFESSSSCAVEFAIRDDRTSQSYGAVGQY
jgi:N-hydroxyarylamine O-acetyltransferase